VPDNYAKVREACERQRRAAEDNRTKAHAARTTPASVLSIADVAEAVSEQLREQRRELLEHMTRLFKLAELKKSGDGEDVRVRNLHRRVTMLESELRRLQRG
jgi:hypothetical protein